MDMPDWTDEETREAKNMKPASLSNLTRLLLLSKVSTIAMWLIRGKSASDVLLPSMEEFGWIPMSFSYGTSRGTCLSCTGSRGVGGLTHCHACIYSLLRVGPLAPAYFPENKQRGTDSPHFYNNHLYNVGPHPSPVADRMLQTACSLSYGPDNWPSVKETFVVEMVYEHCQSDSSTFVGSEQYTFKPHAGRVFNDGTHTELEGLKPV